MTNKDRIIEQWLLLVLADFEMIDSFDDLHVDSIDRAWRDRDRWLEGAIESFVRAHQIQQAHGLQLVLAASIPIAAGVAMHVQSREELTKSLSWSPPSLMVFRDGQAPWQSGFRSRWAGDVGARFLVHQVDLQKLDLPPEVEGTYKTEYAPSDTLEQASTLFLSSAR